MVDLSLNKEATTETTPPAAPQDMTTADLETEFQALGKEVSRIGSRRGLIADELKARSKSAKAKLRWNALPVEEREALLREMG